MRYSDEYLRDVLPRDDPAADLVPAGVHEEIIRWIERDEIEDRNLVSRSTRWTYALANELRLYQFRIVETYRPLLQLFFANSRFPPLLIGLFDREVGPAGFGFIAHVPGGVGWFPRGEIAAWLDFPRLSARFPLIFGEVSYDDHALDHPINATAASWAKCNATDCWGILTAGHVASSPRPGRRIALASGAGGVLVRSFHPPIDAAFIQTATPAGQVSQLPVRLFPAAGQSVVGELRSGQQRRTVVHVDSFMQVVDTRTYAVQLFLDQPFQKGDSGALIRTTGKEAVGIYLGSVKSAAVPTGQAGRALNFQQAVLALDVTPYL